MWATILTVAALVTGAVVGWVLRGRQANDALQAMRASAQRQLEPLRAQLDAARAEADEAAARFEEAEGGRRAIIIEHNINEKLLAEARRARAAALKELALVRAEGVKLGETVERLRAELESRRHQLAQAGSGAARGSTLVVDLTEEPAQTRDG